MNGLASISTDVATLDLWGKYIGPKGAVVGISRLGISAPGGEVMKALGITAKSVVDAARAL